MRKPTAIVLFAFLLGIAATCSAQSAEELKDSISAKESLRIDGVIENQKNLSLIQELEKCGNLNLKKEDYELEFEVSNREKGEIYFTELLSTLKIPVRKTKNKVRRFYEEKYKQK